PRPYPPADMPAGIVPDQQQRLLALSRQVVADPGQEVLRHLADGPSVHEAQEHPAGVRPQEAVAGHGLGVRVGLLGLTLDQEQRRAAGPGVQRRLRQAAPPGLVLVAQHPVGVRLRQPDQPVAGFFFRAYCGSGLVIQCLARFQRTPRRFRAMRTASRVSCRGVQPLAWQTSATRSNVHTLVGLPNRRGLWCKRSLSGSAYRSSRNARAEGGREDFACRQSSPSRAKAWTALRTVPTAQPRLRAICGGQSPWALARRIWQRRAVNAPA